MNKINREDYREFDQPMSRQKFAGAKPLGDATIAKVAKK